jgi:methionyl-tRNA synthetase
MATEFYACTNDDCDAATTVRTWPATRTDPADSTWGDGCEGCGADLEPEPLDPAPPERDDSEAEMEARDRAVHDAAEDAAAELAGQGRRRT